MSQAWLVGLSYSHSQSVWITQMVQNRCISAFLTWGKKAWIAIAWVTLQIHERDIRHKIFYRDKWWNVQRAPFSGTHEYDWLNFKHHFFNRFIKSSSYFSKFLTLPLSFILSLTCRMWICSAVIGCITLVFCFIKKQTTTPTRNMLLALIIRLKKIW